MKTFAKTVIIILITLTGWHGFSQKRGSFKPKKIYTSKELTITQLTENTFVHTTFLQTQDFGNVPCNGLIVRNGAEAVVFDTPADDTASEALLKWISETLRCRVVAVVPTHFHNDCLGGLKTFHARGIPSYAYAKTIALARENAYEVPQHAFEDSLILTVGNQKVVVTFWGEGHTKDNVVGYFPSEQVLFGGCLVKALKADKGYLGDANVAEWPRTVENVKQAYPDVKVLVPGHGNYGNVKLLDYTIQLFRQ